jgi:hypothetical protein
MMLLRRQQHEDLVQILQTNLRTVTLSNASFALRWIPNIVSTRPWQPRTSTTRLHCRRRPEETRLGFHLVIDQPRAQQGTVWPTTSAAPSTRCVSQTHHSHRSSTTCQTRVSPDRRHYRHHSRPHLKDTSIFAQPQDAAIARKDTLRPPSTNTATQSKVPPAKGRHQPVGRRLHDS